MKTTFDVNGIIFGLLDVSDITDLITGSIYRNKKPMNSELQDIVILNNLNFNADVHEGFVFINIYCENFETGEVDITTLQGVTSAVLKIFDEYAQTTSAYFQTKLIYQTLIQDEVQKNMSFSNIKLNCYIER